MKLIQAVGKWHNRNYANGYKTLPAHTGIIAVTDARARHLLQACEYLKIAIPEKLCVIGIDNEELIQYLSRISHRLLFKVPNKLVIKQRKCCIVCYGHKVRLQPILIPP